MKLLALLLSFAASVSMTSAAEDDAFTRRAAAALDPLQPLPWLTDSGGFAPDVWKELQAQWRDVVVPVLRDHVGATPKLEIELDFDGDTHLPFLHFKAVATTSAKVTVGERIRASQPVRAIEVHVFHEGLRYADEEVAPELGRAVDTRGNDASFVSPSGWRRIDFAGDRAVAHTNESGPRNRAASGRVVWQNGVVCVRVAAANAMGDHGVFSLATSVDEALRAGGVYDFPRSRFPAPVSAPAAAASGVFDLNPLFHPASIRPKGPEQTRFDDVDFLDADVLAAFDAPRIGTVADGLSALLLRYELPSAGEVCEVELLGGPRDGAVEALLFEETEEVDGQHLAFVRYTPPAVFGAADGTERLGDVAVRDVVVRVRVETDDGDETTFDRGLKLARAPVVLVHGTYDGPTYCWDWRGLSADFKTESVTARLRERGFRPFLVDYSGSNGLTSVVVGHSEGPDLGMSLPHPLYGPGGPSHFKDNESVLWTGGLDVHGKPGEGISAALRTYRAELGLAAAQVDVVAHSMGGVLCRVWARDEPLPQHAVCREMHGARPPRLPYRRAGNFNRGDIRRLVTISSTHRGSDISRLLQHYSWEDGSAANESYSPWPPAVSYIADSQAGTKTGAFLDQVPNSAALNAVGATPVPAHAIACVAGARDILREDEAGLLYRGRVDNIRFGTPTSFMQRVFQVLHQPADGKRLAEHRDRKSVEHLLLFWAGVFGNSENDCVVRLDSSFGGLPDVCGKGERCLHVARLTDVLHGPAPRYPKVQDHVLDVLASGFERFESKGFPEAGGAIERFNRHHEDPEAWQPRP